MSSSFEEQEFLRRRDGAEVGEEPLSLGALASSSLLVGDVLILRQSAFGTSGEHSLVRHEFAGSWKTPGPAREEVAPRERELERERDKLLLDNRELRRQLREADRQQREAGRKNEGARKELFAADLVRASGRRGQRGPPKTVPAEKMATVHEVRAGQVQEDAGLGGEKKTWVPVAAKWGEQKPFQPLGDEEEAAERRKFLMQRLSNKAAAHVESKQLDEIEEKEKLFLKQEASKKPPRSGLLAPHSAGKQPFNHGMD